jgi:hypothetical protein
MPRRGDSKPVKRRNINRHHQADAMLLDADYFNDNMTHSPKEFRRRFRMKKELFLKIVYGVREYVCRCLINGTPEEGSSWREEEVGAIRRRVLGTVVRNLPSLGTPARG